MRCRRGLLPLLLVLLGLMILSACSGGSSKPQTAGVSGVVSFPAAGDVVTAKRTSATVPDSTVTVEAYTLDGVLVPGASVNPTYDNTVATRIYSYSIPNLKPNVDYVIKAKKGNVVLKKLIASKDMVAGSVAAQTVDSVSTVAVVIASQKLGIVLGDTLPAGKTIAALSTQIGSDVKPALLEQFISAAVTGSVTTITTSDAANYANMFNIVVTSVVDNKDPALVFGGSQTLTTPVPIFAISGTTVTAPSSDSSTWTAPSTTDLSNLVTGTSDSYSPPAEVASTYTDLAEKYLAAQDISNAALNYEKALSLDPTDKKANFGGAITSGVMLLEDPDVKSIVTKWGGVLPTVNEIVRGTSPIQLPFLNMTSIRVNTGSTGMGGMFKNTAKTVAGTTSAQKVLAAFKALQAKLPQQKAGFKSMAKTLALVPDTAPSVSEMQALIDNVIIPRIDKILARLAKVEGQSFTFTITKAMQANTFGEDVNLSDGEFYTLDAALQLFQTIFKITTSYNFDVPSPYTYNTIGQDPLALINSTGFFTLKSDGAAKMNAALTYARAAAAKATLAFNILKVRTSGAGPIDIASWNATTRTDVTNALGNITTSLTGQADITIGDQTVTVNATKFFTNPLTKSNLPSFGYDVARDATLSVKYDEAVAGEGSYSFQMWDGTAVVTQTVIFPVHCSIAPKSDLPDYTMNGILPGNTAADDVAKFNGLLPVLDGKVLSADPGSGGRSFATDGTYAYSLSQTSTTPSTTGVVNNFVIKKIALATGVVSDYAAFSSTVWLDMLYYSGGTFYVTRSEGTSVANNSGGFDPVTSFNIYQLTGTAPQLSLASTASYHANLPAYSWVGALAPDGTDLYYVVQVWNQLTSSDTFQVRKLSNLITDSLLFAEDHFIDSIAFRNGSIFTADNGELKKRDLTGAVLARYINGGMDFMTGGYLYQVFDGKLLKIAGTPTGGAAKVTN
jgi:hypothetical protein